MSLDDLLDDSLGPLEYVRGSHMWGENRRRTANVFFDSDRRALMEDAAKQVVLTETQPSALTKLLDRKV